MSLKRVTPGEVLPSIPVATYNAIVDLVNKSRSSDFAGGERAEFGGRKYSTITIRNGTGVDLDRWAVLQPVAPLVRPVDNEAGFFEVVALDGSDPESSTAPFCILLQPLAPDAIGLGVVAGATPALVTMQDESHLWCSPEPDVHTSLYSAEYGQARILWAEPPISGSGSEPRRAYVLLWSVPDVGSVSGSDAWVTCKKRVTDIRCTDEGWEYDAEFDYYSIDGRLLFTSDTPCPGMDGGTDPPAEDEPCCTGVEVSPTLTVTLINEGGCECLDSTTFSISKLFTSEWTANTTTCDGTPLYVSLACVAEGANAGKYVISLVCNGDTVSAGYAEPISCFPFSASYTGLTWSGGNHCCREGTFGVEISESGP